MRKAINRTVDNLCDEIDQLQDEVQFWKNKYDELMKDYRDLRNEYESSVKSSLSDTIMLALSLKEDGNGGLIIDKDERKNFKNYLESK